jgi:phthalate 3,4-dioxygenase beta subunit
MNAKSAIETQSLRDLRLEFEELLYREAWLLDNDRLDEWLELLDRDIHYLVPVRLDRTRGKEDLRQEGLMAHLDENLQGLTFRVKRVQTGATFSDEPPARIRHFVSNVQVMSAHDGMAEVASNIMVFRSHVKGNEYTLIGAREDKWKRCGDSWLLKDRLVVLDHTTIAGLSVLF